MRATTVKPLDLGICTCLAEPAGASRKIAGINLGLEHGSFGAIIYRYK